MENEKELIKILSSLVSSNQQSSTRLDDQNKEIKVLRASDRKRSAEIKKQQEKIEKQEKEIEKQKEGLKEQKNDLIQYFGLFVAIFTAISINIQLLRFAQNAWTVAGLMLMVNTAPLFFFWLIRAISRGHNLKDYVQVISIFIILFSTGYFLIDKGMKDVQPNTIIERIKTEEVKTVESNTESKIKENTVVESNKESQILENKVVESSESDTKK